MSLQAFGQTIIVKKEKATERNSGGILIPDSVQDGQCERATVISVGEGFLSAVLGKRVELGITFGTRVFVNKFAGQKLDYDGEEYTALLESDIVAIES